MFSKERVVNDKLQAITWSYRNHFRRQKKMSGENQRLDKQEGYRHGIDPGLELYHLGIELGIKEMTFYGCTVDNT